MNIPKLIGSFQIGTAVFMGLLVISIMNINFTVFMIDAAICSLNVFLGVYNLSNKGQ